MRSMFVPALAAAAAVLTFSMDSYAVDYEFAGFSTAQFAGNGQGLIHQGDRLGRGSCAVRLYQQYQRR